MNRRDHQDHKKPPPLWLVSQGGEVSGPLPTRALLSGVLHGRVAESCRVREVHWSSWRAFAEIREIASLRRKQARSIAGAQPVRAKTSLLRAVARAESHSEALLFALSAAVTSSHADVGAVTRVRDAWYAPTTSAVVGPELTPLLGLPIPSSDLALAAARAGRAFAGDALQSSVHLAVAKRLERPGAPLSGVAMVPIVRGSELLAMLELGRADHPFRQGDLHALRRIAEVSLRRLARLDQGAANATVFPVI